MKPVLAFFVFLIILGSASAEIISITSKDSGTKTLTTFPNVDVDDENANIEQITIRTRANGVEVPQSFTPPTDPELFNRGIKGAVTFRRVNTPDKNIPPPIAEFYFLPTPPPQIVSRPTTPTGAITYTVEERDESGVLVLILILVAASIMLIVLEGTSVKTKVIFAILILGIFSMVKWAGQEPTAYVVQDFEQPASIPQTNIPQTNVVNAFAITWTNGGPVTFLRGDTECSDGIDNDGDGLIDFPDDPGCGSGTDDFETDMLEYDNPPVVDNEIDVYDIVNWIQYFNGDFSVLVNCVNPACTGSGANCVGDTDPNDDTFLTAADMTFLQTTELANTDSRTVPVSSPICFNP